MKFLHCTLFAAGILAAAGPVIAGPAPAADPSSNWDLTPIYPSPAAWKAAKGRLAADLPRIKAYEGRLGQSASTLREAMDLLFGLRKEFNRLSVYASLIRDENTRDTAALERSQEIELLGTELSQATSFVNPELIALGEAKLRGFVDAEPGLAQYRFPLLEIVRAAPHTLGAEAEGVLSSAGLVTGSPSSFYQILADADMPWPSVKLSDGTEVRLDQSAYALWRAAPNRADRKAVFEAFWGKMREYERTFGVALFSQVKADWFTANARKYPSSLAAAIDSDDIPVAVYRTLLAETNANLPTLHRYFRLRARLLGVSDLRYWDIYPPIVKLDKRFPLAEGRALATAAVRPLGADYAAQFAACVNGRYTSVYPRPGKTGGAYMDGAAYDVHPYVLMNYNDDYESVSTIAHEWGHGMHSLLANRAQPFPTAGYSIFIAEIASTTNEALLLDHMLKVAKDDEERMYYLGSALERLRATYFRQAMFAEFELAIHEAVEGGQSLSGAKLSGMYGELLRRYQGQKEGAMTVDDLVTIEWAYIPHFYRDFYVYQYATSIAAGSAFSGRILRGEPGVLDKYLGMLKAGGSGHPYEIVKRAGVDLATPVPYRAIAERMNSIMDQIEAILARRK